MDYSNLDDKDVFAAPPFVPHLAFTLFNNDGEPVRIKLRIDEAGEIINKEAVIEALFSSYGLPKDVLDAMMSGPKTPITDF